MSVIYMSLSDDPGIGVGVAVFKASAMVPRVEASGTTLSIALGAAVLVRAGFVPNPTRSAARDLGACIAQAAAIRLWFDRGPSVGGACKPEEFILSELSERALAASPMLVGALAFAWCEPEYDDSIVFGARRNGSPEWFHIQPTSTPTRYDLTLLSETERATMPHDPAPPLVEAIRQGLAYFERSSDGANRQEDL